MKKLCSVSVCYLDTREGDSGGGIGANHQGDEGGTEVPEHVGELERKRKTGEKLYSTVYVSIKVKPSTAKIMVISAAVELL